jgi:5-methylcytosine-specific restriction protein A
LAVRRRVLERDGWRCRLGFLGCAGAADSVDHIIELADGGAEFDEGNLQAVCRRCNSVKGNRAAVVRSGRRVRSW